MTRFKFRCWNLEEEIMYNDCRLDLAHGCEYMQRTGLKDKNGKEIYEGDIVSIQHPRDKGGDFGDAIGGVFRYQNEGAFYHTNNSGRPKKRMWEYTTVIGNVYENHDLYEKLNQDY